MPTAGGFAAHAGPLLTPMCGLFQVPLAAFAGREILRERRRKAASGGMGVEGKDEHVRSLVCAVACWSVA